MSFMSAGSECSTNSNPLAQFSKQTNGDRSLQQSLINQHQQLYNANSIRQDSHMNQIDRENFDRFVSNNNNSLHNFQPMKHELDMMNNRPMVVHNNNNVASWGHDFPQSVTKSVPQLSETRNGNWAQDFHTSIEQPLQQQQNRPLQSNYPRYGGGMPMMMMNRPMMSSNVSQTQGKVVELDSTKWEDQFKEIEKDMAMDEVQDDIVDDKYKANFDEVWESLNNNFKDDEFFNKEYEASWEKDFNTYASGRINYGQYKPSKRNQFLENPSAFEIGVKLMESGARLSEAALLFEAAVQQDDSHVEAWLRLGQVQTQNEKEIAGITALEKCLQLDPKNLKALMSLAISYVNEGYDNAAYATLERWIDTKYPQITETLRLKNPKISDEDRYSLNKRITELFIKLAQLSPTIANMDADVQTGLGVLFYSMEEFDKTIDCFKAAIQQNPNDSLMWNRLGASLANSDRSEEAIELYSKLLQLNPNFVRARYNLGVSCINMGLYKQLVEHLLGGLSMHNVEGVLDADTTSSLSLVETLKRLFLAMDRRDLIEKVRPGMDLEQFRSDFNF